MADDDIVISASVVTNNPEHATRAAEVFARAAAGLVLDGVGVSIGMQMVPDEPDDERPEP